MKSSFSVLALIGGIQASDLQNIPTIQSDQTDLIKETAGRNHPTVKAGSGGSGDKKAKNKNTLPAVSGRFFYVDLLPMGEPNSKMGALFATKVRVGDYKDGDMPLWISTDEHHIGIVTTSCGTCTGMTRWSQRAAAAEPVARRPVSEEAVVYNEDENKVGSGLVQLTFQGEMEETKVEFGFHRGHWEEGEPGFSQGAGPTTVGKDAFENGVKKNSPKLMNVLAVIASDKEYKSSYSGFIGLAPFVDGQVDQGTADGSLNARVESDNFMAQLQALNQIEHQVASISWSSGPGDSSSVKFGGWDEEALADRGNLTLLRTKSKSSWAVALDSITVGDVDVEHQKWSHAFTTDKDKALLFEPALPYVYVPKEDWQIIRDMLEAAEVKEAHKVECDDVSLICKWKATCESVITAYEGVDQQRRDSSIHIQISEGDIPDAAVFDITLSASDLLISGTVLGDSADTCYLPIFVAAPAQRHWLAGGQILQSYYTVLDATPMTERKEEYVQIGIGRKSNRGLAWEKYGGDQYDAHHFDDMSGAYPSSSVVALAGLCGGILLCILQRLCYTFCIKRRSSEEEAELYGAKVDPEGLNAANSATL